MTHIWLVICWTAVRGLVFVAVAGELSEKVGGGIRRGGERVKRRTQGIRGGASTSDTRRGLSSDSIVSGATLAGVVRLATIRGRDGGLETGDCARRKLSDL